MKIHSQIRLILAVLLFPYSVFAQETCVSGKPNQGNMVSQLNFAKAKMPITEIIYRQYELKPKTEGGTNCKDCEAAKAKRPEDLAAVASFIEGVPAAPKLLFKPQCLERSNQFDANAGEVSCPGGSRSKSRDLCQTSEILIYQNAVISSFMSCAKKLGMTTVSPSTLYGIYSLESGFKPQFASNGGVGMGQVTGIFVDDVHQKWRGYKFLEKMAQTDLKECEAAKVLAQKDTQEKPKLSNVCSFIQLGEGFERNVLYTMVGMANAWEKDISPKMQSYIDSHPNSPQVEEIKNLILANTYGYGGRAAGRAMASRLSGLDPEKALEQARKPMTLVNKSGKRRSLNSYTARISARQNKIGEKLPEPLKTAFAKNGAKACIAQ